MGVTVANSVIPYLKFAVFAVLLLPFIFQVDGVYHNTLGPDPAEALADATGEWALRILLMTLLMSPLRTLGIFPQALRFRRMLGLFAFFYAVLHALIFLAFFVGWDFGLITEELVERPYITVGFASLLILLPLAVTSTQRLRSRMGRRWLALHRWVYLASGLALLHLWWQVRSSWFEAAIYIALFAVLMLFRLFNRKRRF